MLRLSIFVAILAGLIAATVLVGNRGGAYNAARIVPPTLPDMPGVDLIAYTDLEGRIGLIRPDGTSEIKISPENGLFGWPTWSPDARRIAFSGFASVGGGRDDTLNLYISELTSEEPEVAYVNEPGMGPILPTMPHYIMWAPNSKRLSFMASVPNGLTLFLKDFDDASGPSPLVIGSPLYASWSTDSRYMLVHRGADHFLVDASTGQSVQDTTSQSTGYRAPAWLPNTNRATFLSGTGEGPDGLFTAGVESGREGRSLIGEFSNNAAFLWSPNGETLAVSQSLAPGGLIYDGIQLLAADGTRKTAKVEDAVVAFFWSPDSTKIAYISLTASRGVLNWMIFDVESGESWHLVDFTPSREQLTILQFFDQFAYSHAPWSPESDSLVFSGSLHAEGISASTRQQAANGIYVTDVGRNPTTQRIADGLLAFWSPR